MAAQAEATTQRTWFFQGMGLGALMLVAVYSVHGLTHHDGDSDDTSNHGAAFAFQPAGLRTRGGLRSANSVRMFSAHDLREHELAQEPPLRMTSVNMNVPAFDPNDAQAVKQAMREAASLAKRIGDGSSMSLLATTALNSGGDPRQLASVFAVMPEEDVAKVEELKEEVVKKAKKMSVLEMAQNAPGVSAPMDFFDPAGFCTDISEGKLCFYREVEIKHGRVGMLASLGFLVGESFHPLFGGNIDVPSYLAFQETPLQTFWPAVVAAIAIPEVFSIFAFESSGKERWALKTDRVPGDMGFDPMRLKPTDPEALKVMQTKEINNGRLAMLAAAGMIAQELASGTKILVNER